MAETAIPAFCTQCRSRCGCTAFVEKGALITGHGTARMIRVDSSWTPAPTGYPP